MLSIDKRTNKITITKGDNADIVIKLTDGKGKSRAIFADDVLTMTVRDYQDTVVFTTTAVNGVFSITPADTATMTKKNLYFYDVQLTTFGGKVYTVIEDAIFSVQREATRT